MLTGRLPYGAEVSRARTRKPQRRLRYVSAAGAGRGRSGLDRRRAAQGGPPDPARRYARLSEFVYDLRHPNPAFAGRTRVPLFERNPLLFWRLLSLVLALAVVWLLARR